MNILCMTEEEVDTLMGCVKLHEDFAEIKNLARYISENNFVGLSK